MSWPRGSCRDQDRSTAWSCRHADGMNGSWCWSRDDEVQLARTSYRGVATAHAELAEDVPHVCADGVDRDEHGLGNLFGSEQLGQMTQYLELLLRQMFD